MAHWEFGHVYSDGETIAKLGNLSFGGVAHASKGG
jgi:hypothetical protein